MSLSPNWKRDRLGRWTTMTYDGLRHLVTSTDPAGRTTTYNWCICGALTGIVDANGNTTTFNRDVESRVISKVYADSTGLSYTYENSTSRLKTLTNARGQNTNYTYNADDTLAQVSYTGTPATPTVTYAYDASYNRIASMADVTGTTSYSYNPIVSDTSLACARAGESRDA